MKYNALNISHIWGREHAVSRVLPFLLLCMVITPVCSCSDIETRERFANCKSVKKLAKTTTALIAALM